MDRIVYGKYILSDASDTVNGLIKEGAVLVRGERMRRSVHSRNFGKSILRRSSWEEPVIL